MDTIRRLIVRMATENCEWGDTRIRGARGNLGHQVARGTIANVRTERGLEPVGLGFVIRPPLEAGPCPGSGRSNAHG